MSRIAILGAGAWGTALAISLARRGGHKISLWAHSPARAEALAESGINNDYLPGFVLPADVRITSVAADAIEGAHIILFVVPSQHLRSVVQEIAPLLRPQQILLSASKGIEEKTLLRMSQVLCEFTPHHAVGALSGPSFAQEVAAGLPTALVVACADTPHTHDDETLSKTLQEAFTSPSLRIYRNDDVTGVELGGALKNVIAIACGIVAGLALGSNANAGLITRGIAEMTRLSIACGGRRDTLMGLAGVGDLVLTCNGTLSRNRALGMALGQGEHLTDILKAMHGKVAEGVPCTRAALGLAKRYGIEMPIIEQISSIVYDDKVPAAAIHELMNRPGRTE
jgi:glycerol-3-phosphate dehydrogenase (NAD(P)+)